MRTLHTAVIGLLLAGSANAHAVTTSSPDGSNRIEVNASAKGPVFSVSRKGQVLITPSPLGIILQHGPLDRSTIGADGFAIGAQQASSGSDNFTQPAGKTSSVKAAWRQTDIALDASTGSVKHLILRVRAYDDGVAFRYIIPAQPGVAKLAIQDELTAFRFGADYRCWGLNQGRFENSFEGEHDAIQASQMRPFNLFQAPLVCKTGKAAFAIAESDLGNYPGAWYAGMGDAGNGAQVVLTPRPDNDPDLRAHAVAASIDASGGFETPWRVVMLGDSAGKLTESSLINALAKPSTLADTSWIKPGLSAWDWWNGNDFVLPAPHGSKGQRSGMNTATYKAYADFAAELGLSYILIDEGWSLGSTIEPNPAADVTRARPEVDIAEIVRYAASKGVGVMVWLQWKQLERQMDEALATYQKWGIKGIKVDFINRYDQQVMPFYHRLLSKAAEHRLMVDLHGAFPPAGLARTYPNYMTQEGVLGAENNKWSRRITARHNINLAFTRGLLGPMDYTPGGFRHLSPAAFAEQQRFINPYVMTTRGAALAMYVIYDSPLQMVSDSPPAYRKADDSWEDGVDFLKLVPASWDETRFISGDLDDHVVLARRRGDTWYIGGMTERAKSVKIALGFLGDGAYSVRSWQDGASLSSLRVGEQAATKRDTLTLSMSANGGGVAVITRRKAQ